MKRMMIIAGTVVLLLGTVGIAWAALPKPVAGSLTSASSSVQVLHYDKKGGVASCDGDSCGIGDRPPVSFTLPAVPDHSRYSVIITVSFDYVTTGRGPFKALGALTTSSGTRLVTAPWSHFLAPAPQHDSRTLTFRAPYLSAGTEYRFQFAPRSSAGRGTTSITASDVLVKVDGLPA